MANDIAKARREAFLKAKADAGDVNKLIEQIKNRPWQVFFTDDGEIVCFTNGETPEVLPEWKTYEFTREQTAVLHDQDLRRFRVKQNPKDASIYSIELKPIVNAKIAATTEFVTEVELGTTTKFDVKVVLTESEFTVNLSKAAKKVYDGVYPISATVNGQRLLKFSFTELGDPHYVYHQEIVAIADLLVNDKVVRQMPTDLTSGSIYTNKLFDTYVRK